MIDSDDLRTLAVDLDRAAARAPEETRAVVVKGNINIKRDWRSAWSGLAHALALPAAITDDVRYGLGVIVGEVGPDKGRRQGALGNLIEFGSENNAPIPGGLPAAEAEAPRFERALGELGERLAAGG